jgi:hypothetical protein
VVKPFQVEMRKGKVDLFIWVKDNTVLEGIGDIKDMEFEMLGSRESQY